MNQATNRRLDMAHGTVEYLASAIELIAERSTIPKEVLTTLTRKQIDALLVAMQGIDPLEVEQLGDCGKK
ncbi:MAG: hypothetical protein LBV04_10095 [Deferribacteraceae bacterium]|nr:hypothetical protein [Deferribacteraceae bacterium]